MVLKRLRRRLNRVVADDAMIAYRATTAGTVVVSVLAAVTQQAVSGFTGVAAIVLVPVGFAFSFWRRRERNILLKVVLAIALFVAFGAFINAVRFAGNVDDARAPLVAVFLWVQVLHSFDVPRARDLSFSLAAGVVLIALAGSLAFSTGFIVYVVVYAALFIAALVLAYHTDLRSVDGALSREIKAESRERLSRRSLMPALRRVATLGAATVLCTAVVFVFLPRLPAQQVAALPFSLPRAASDIPGFDGEVAFPDEEGGGGESEVGSSEAFDPDTYFGYGESMSLRVRGRLSEDLVMRVRTPRPTLYRGQAFDRYDDGRWSSSDTELEEVQRSGEDSLHLPTPRAQLAGDEIVQTFYVERELPNLVFHTQRADEVFIETTRVRIDDHSSIRTPFTLEKDTIYSVISELPNVSASELRSTPTIDVNDPRFAQYLDLPPTLDGRFSELARRITRAHPTTADKAEAVERWLRQNKKYQLDISRDPPGRDPIDVFVFDRDEGFCEQIASTMALMLRASGVPTRVVTGFGEGERNLFTGYWEVRNSDAHAWVEVFYPSVGWISYDPTFGVPLASAANTTFMLAPLQKIAGSFPTEALGGVSRAASRVMGALPGPGWLGAPILVLAIAAAAVALRNRRRTRRHSSLDAPARAVEAWLALEKALRSRGWKRADHETALEFAERLSPVYGQVGTNVRKVAEEFSEFRYGTGRDGEELARWEEETRRTAQKIRAPGRGTALLRPR